MNKFYIHNTSCTIFHEYSIPTLPCLETQTYDPLSKNIIINNNMHLGEAKEPTKKTCEGLLLNLSNIAAFLNTDFLTKEWPRRSSREYHAKERSDCHCYPETVDSDKVWVWRVVGLQNQNHLPLPGLCRKNVPLPGFFGRKANWVNYGAMW